MPSEPKTVQVRLSRVTPSHCRVVLDNPPVNIMGPEFRPGDPFLASDDSS